MTTKILYVIVNLEVGGTERQLFELVSGLNPERFSPHVCCLRGGGPLSSELSRVGVPVTLLKSPSLNYSRKIRTAHLFISQIYELYRFMRRERPVIVHGMLPMAFVTAGIAARLAGIPMLVTSRRSLGCYKEKRFALRQLENMVNLWTDEVVANSKAVGDDTLCRERIDGRRLSVIYNGVRIPEQKRWAGWKNLIGREIEGPVVCLLANFYPYKGHRIFIDAAARVLKKIPGVKFLLVGDGKLRPEIEGRIAELGLKDSVFLPGQRDDAVEILTGVDIAALASYEEGFSNVVLEAMALAKPVVATRVGGVPEAVEDGKTGLLVSPDDADGLAGAIVRLLENRGEAEAMGRAGMERARRVFTIEKMISSYEKLYDKLLERVGVQK